MSWSILVARPFGVPIRVHASFLLVIALGALQWASHGVSGALFGALLSLAVFACIALHELGHSLAARSLGMGVRQIVLMPLGGIAELVGKPKRPRDEMLVAVAGPAVNVAIASVLLGVFAALHVTGASPLDFSFREPGVLTFLQLLFASNVVLAVFNMLPFFPLDGGRVLRAALASGWGDEKATRWASWVGQGGAIALGLWAFWSGQIFLALIAVLLFSSAGAARVDATVPKLLAQLRAGEVSERGAIVLEPTTTMNEAFRATLGSTQSVFPVALGTQVLGALSRDDIRSSAMAHPPAAHSRLVTGEMQRELPRLDETACASELLSIFERAPHAIVAIHGESGLVGFVSMSHLTEHVLPFAHALTHYRARREAFGAAESLRG